MLPPFLPALRARKKEERRFVWKQQRERDILTLLLAPYCRRESQFPLETICVLKVEVRVRARKQRTHSEKGFRI